MKSIRFVLIALFLIGSAFGASTSATSWSIDQSDLWWNPAENGWGIQFVQRGNTIFAMMFVYDPAGNPTWYVATLEWVGKPNGVFTWSGDLYTAHGTFNGAYFQNGQFGDISGTSSCTNGDVGTLTASDMNVTPFGMVGRLSISSTTTGCQNTGQIGGVRTDQ